MRFLGLKIGVFDTVPHLSDEIPHYSSIFQIDKRHRVPRHYGHLQCPLVTRTRFKSQNKAPKSGLKVCDYRTLKCQDQIDFNILKSVIAAWKFHFFAR